MTRAGAGAGQQEGAWEEVWAWSAGRSRARSGCGCPSAVPSGGPIQRIPQPASSLSASPGPHTGTGKGGAGVVRAGLFRGSDDVQGEALRKDEEGAPGKGVQRTQVARRLT